MKHLKSLGLAALAVTALTAMIGASSAAAFEFHAGAGVALEGVKINAHTFTVQGQNVNCNIVTFNGISAASGTSTEQQMHPVYNSCTAFGLPANVDTTGCQYKFNANTTTLALESCSNINGILEIDSANAFSHCHVNVGNQAGINNQRFANTGSTNTSNATLTEASNANNIVAVINVDNGLCPLSHTNPLPLTVNNAGYTGETGIMGPVSAPQTHWN